MHAADSIGLLYRITRALAELDIDIHRGLVQTHGDNVVDVFYVPRPAAGQKVIDPEHQREVERTIAATQSGLR